jgi:hypothetical protein
MAQSMVDDLLRGYSVITKHPEGEDVHPGTGTTQDVHAGGRTAPSREGPQVGPRAWAAALNRVRIPGPATGQEIQSEGQRIERQFTDQPGFFRFVDAVQMWASGMGVEPQREAERAARTGTLDDLAISHRPQRRRDAEGLLLLGRTVANAPRNAPRLFRATRVPGVSAEQVRAAFQRGSEFSMPGLASFSEDADFAHRWANLAQPGQETPVVFEVREGGKGLHIAPLLSPMFNHQREWITGGSYRVVDAKRTNISGMEGVIIELTQTEGPKQQVRKRLDLDDVRSRILDELATPLPKIMPISKHPEGEDIHPGTGTDQSVHAGDRRARQPGAEAGAIFSPYGLDAMPPRAIELLGRRLEKLGEMGYDLSERSIRQRLRRPFERARKDNPEVFDAGMTWYSDANLWAEALAETYDLEPRQVAGIVSALSPNMLWEANRELAHKLIDTLRMDPEYGNDLIPMRRLSQMTPAELYAVADFSVIDPTTLFPTEQSGMFAIPAIEMYRGQDPGQALGGPKIRSFFNNILLPDRRTSFTTDTHMMRLILDDPDIAMGRVQHLITDAPNTFRDRADHPDNWKWGLHGWVQEAAHKEAEALGVLPHQLQAVDWGQWIAEHGSKRGPGIGGARLDRGVVRGGD